jgi:hypothetical protein
LCAGALFEEHPFVGEPVDAGGCRALVSITSQMVGPERIDHDEDNVRRAIRLWHGLGVFTWPQQAAQPDGERYDDDQDVDRDDEQNGSLDRKPAA